MNVISDEFKMEVDCLWKVVATSTGQYNNHS